MSLRADPRRLYDLSPQRFEEVVAELLASFGWNVSLPPTSRDGGLDILAVSRDALGLETAWAVECKRYSPENPVGVDVVRGLYGVKQGLRLPQALLVTTSTVTPGARQFAEGVGDIKIADKQVLVEWLRQYTLPLTKASYVAGKRFQSCFVSYNHKDEAFAAVAKDRGLIAVNVCERGGRLYEADRAEIIWLPEHITAFSQVASPELQFALLLALWTGQRQGTLIDIAWSQYDGTHIRLQPNKQRHGKKKKRIVIPVGAPLKTALDARRPEKPEGTILRNTFGKAWTGDGFRSSWSTAFDRAKLGDADLHFHDLRGTAVTRLALAGCSVPQIAAITGHSPRDVDEILKAHYLVGQSELAEQAIVKLVAAYG